jgi:nickel and cobalt resistance protein CnrR
MAVRVRVGLAVLVIGFVALGAGFGGAWLHGRTMSAPSAPKSLHDRMHQTLKLDPSQDAKLQTLEARFQIEKGILDAEMASANRELADAISADKIYTPKVQAAIDHFHHAMGALQKISVEHVFDMRAILTPQQQAIFDAQVRGALLESSGASDNGQKAP